MASHAGRTTERTRSGGRHGRATANPQGRPCGRSGALARTPEQRPRAAAAQGGRSGPNSGRAHLSCGADAAAHHRTKGGPRPPGRPRRGTGHRAPAAAPKGRTTAARRAGGAAWFVCVGDGFSLFSGRERL